MIHQNVGAVYLASQDGDNAVENMEAALNTLTELTNTFGEPHLAETANGLEAVGRAYRLAGNIDQTYEALDMSVSMWGHLNKSYPGEYVIPFAKSCYYYGTTLLETGGDMKGALMFIETALSLAQRSKAPVGHEDAIRDIFSEILNEGPKVLKKYSFLRP